MLKSNYDLVGGTFVRWYVAVQNFGKFARVQAVQNVAQTSIIYARYICVCLIYAFT